MEEMAEWLTVYLIQCGFTTAGIVLTILAIRDWWYVRDQETRYRVFTIAAITAMTLFPLFYIGNH